MLFIVTEDWAFVTHRLHTAVNAQKKGIEVALMARSSGEEGKLQAVGIKHFTFPLSRGSLSIFNAVISIISIRRVIKAYKPDVVHAVSIKPIIFSGLVAILSDIRIRRRLVFALGGLGHLFLSTKLKTKLLKFFTLIALKVVFLNKETTLILQNKDDADDLIKEKVINGSNIKFIKGAGVETEKFKPLPLKSGRPKVLLPARLIYEKGILEFVEAAKILNADKQVADFIIAGNFDPDNPSSIPEMTLHKWVSEGWVQYLGYREDMLEVYADATIVCLPSYREGLPKALLEAASVGRPLVSFDVPGCREIVRDGENGVLVKNIDAVSLASGLMILISDRAKCKTFGQASRNIVCDEFSSEKISEQTIRIWEDQVKK